MLSRNRQADESRPIRAAIGNAKCGSEDECNKKFYSLFVEGWPKEQKRIVEIHDFKIHYNTRQTGEQLFGLKGSRHQRDDRFGLVMNQLHLVDSLCVSEFSSSAQETRRKTVPKGSEFDLYVESPEERLQLLHHAFVYGVEYVLLLIGDGNGGIST